MFNNKDKCETFFAIANISRGIHKVRFDFIGYVLFLLVSISRIVVVLLLLIFVVVILIVVVIKGNPEE